MTVQKVRREGRRPGFLDGRRVEEGTASQREAIGGRRSGIREEKNRPSSYGRRDGIKEPGERPHAPKKKPNSHKTMRVLGGTRVGRRG